MGFRGLGFWWSKGSEYGNRKMNPKPLKPDNAKPLKPQTLTPKPRILIKNTVAVTRTVTPDRALLICFTMPCKGTQNPKS